jgi:hypothetical protein
MLKRWAYQEWFLIRDFRSQNITWRALLISRSFVLRFEIDLARNIYSILMINIVLDCGLIFLIPFCRGEASRNYRILTWFMWSL